MTQSAFEPSQRESGMPTSAAGPTPAAGGQQLVASFDDYLGAQELVDRMSDGGFAVQNVRIIGDGVRTVEHVTGRLTNGKAALAGAASGAWFGLLIGLLVGIFTTGPAWLLVVLASTAIGAVWGAVFGYVAHWSTRGRRDFSSVRTLQAQRYDVYVDTAHAAEAAQYVTAPRTQ
jgi:hypothetical protein